MRGLLVLAMKGRAQAAMAVVVSGMLALLLGPLMVVSNGLVVLATLRNGAREGLLVVAFSTMAVVLLGLLILGQGVALGVFGLLLWLPAWAVGVILGATGRVASAVEGAAFGGMLMVGLQYLLTGDPSSFWGGLLQDYLARNWDGAVAPEVEQQLIGAMAALMVGGVSAFWAFGLSLAVLFGLWAQTVLEGDARFGAAFRGLRLSGPWRLLPPLLLALGLTSPGPGMAEQLLMVAMVPFLLQGLAVAHALVAASDAARGWLFALYAVVLIGLPHSLAAVALAGYADSWLNFRSRMRGASGEPPDRDE